MNTAVATIQPPSITAAMAERYGMRTEAFEATLRATVVPKETTREEFAAFLMVAKEHGLNPLTREIYAFPKRGGGIQPIVSVDGWLHILNSHPAFNGLTFIDHLDDKGLLVSITCRVWRKDRDHPIECTEYLAECRRNTEPWQQWPRRMLRHKAMVQAARYAFGFADVIDADEAERWSQVGRLSTDKAPGRPSLAKALELAATPRPQEPPQPGPVPPQPEDDEPEEEDDGAFTEDPMHYDTREEKKIDQEPNPAP
jgi:phage recombination protein Bet